MFAFALFQMLAILPALAAVGLLIFGLATLRQRSRFASASALLLGSIALTGWVVALVIGRLAVATISPAAFGELGQSQVAAMAAAGYASYLVIGALFMVVSARGSAGRVVATPLRFLSSPGNAQSEGVVRIGLRIFSVYLMAFAVVMTVWNSGLLLSFR